MIKIGLLFSLIFSILTLFGQSQISVHGVVYNDVDSDGRYTESVDQPLSNVLVSNGKTICETNRKGTYHIQANINDFIYTIKPEGFRSNDSEYSIPEFYQRITKAEENQIINFPLYANTNESQFTVRLIGDPQVEDDQRLAFLEAGVTSMKQQKADFNIVLGDVADYNLEMHQKVKQKFADFAVPNFYVPGNHDLSLWSTQEQTHFENYNQQFGPSNYAFNYGKVHFIVLATVNYEGFQEDKQKKGSYFGGIDSTQLNWLAQDLRHVKKNQLVVILTHIPLLTEYTDASSIHAIHHLLKPYKNVFAAAGHLHMVKSYMNNEQTLWEGKGVYETLVVGATCGAMWTEPMDHNQVPISTCMDGAPKGYFLLDVVDNTYSYRFVPQHYDQSHQMNITLTESTDHADVTVNWFVGKPSDQVYLSTDEVNWTAMTNTEGYSPFVHNELPHKVNVDGWTPGEHKTDHLWISTLHDIDKVSTIYIKAIDCQGKEFFDSYQLKNHEK